MQKKLIIILVILLVLSTAFVVLYSYFKGGGSNENTNQDNANQVVTNQNQNQNQNQNANISLQEQDQANLKSIATAYAERYGSFSNQNNFENLEDLKIWMSKSLQKTTETYVAAERTKNINSTVYHGYTTSTLSTTINSYSSSQAQVTVLTRRQEVNDATNQSTTYYQDLVLNFIKEDDSWKVNQATWQGVK